MPNAWNRINTLLLLLVFFALVGVIALLASGAHGGPLDPPGAPGSTDSVRLPGTPISSIPYTMSEPGSYYLTRNLTANSGDGITIGASDVTLDLMGFSLIGSGDAGSAVTRSSGQGATIRNGSIRGWGVGVDVPDLRESTFEDLRISATTSGLIVGERNAISRVMVVSATRGIIVGESGDNGGGSIADSAILESDHTGIEIKGSHVSVRNNVINSSFAVGVSLLSGSSDNHITDNQISNNGSGAPGMGGVVIWAGADRNLVARNRLSENVPNAILNGGTNSRLGPLVTDAALTSANPWSNVAY